jgi:hypothetical protein
MSNRDRLIKLFRMLGSDNPHERENAFNLIDEMLRKHRATWSDLPGLLGLGRSTSINPDLARHVAGLGSRDLGERRNARRWITDLLTRKRKTWNHLTDLLCWPSSSSWAIDEPAEIGGVEGEAIKKRSLPPSFVVLTPKEAAARLRVSVSFLAKARGRGDGPPFIAIGRSVRYSESALFKWMQLQQRLSTRE